MPAIVAIRPIFLSPIMYGDRCKAFTVGERIASDVVLIDAAAAQWPTQVTVRADVRIEPRPPPALRGTVAARGELRICSELGGALGAEIAVRSGPLADWLNPPFRGVASGQIIREEVVSRGYAKDWAGIWQPISAWQLPEVARTERQLGRYRPFETGGAHDDGFLFHADLDAIAVEPYQAR